MRFHFANDFTGTALRRRFAASYNQQCRAYAPFRRPHHFTKKPSTSETPNLISPFFSVFRRIFSSKSSDSSMGLLSWYLGKLESRPILTKSLSSGLIYAVADTTSQNVGGLDRIRQVKAKYPALLFKKQLTAYIEKIYGIIRDNAKKELSPVLSSCIKALKNSHSQSSSESATRNWQSVIDYLNGLLSTLKDNFVPPVLVQKIFVQLFSYINVQLFNSLLLHKECCTFNSGEYVKMGLTELELWYGDTHEYAGSSFDELKYVKQAVRLLIMQQKLELTYDDLTTELCPIMSSQQLYRICTLYGDDNRSDNVPPEVISNLKILASEDSNDPDSNS